MKKKIIELRFTHQQIADITLAHLKLIREKLKHTDLNRFSYISWTFYISDERLEYCPTSIKAIGRFFRLYGLCCHCEKYSNYTPLSGKMIHCYTWKLSKIKDDNLPF